METARPIINFLNNSVELPSETRAEHLFFKDAAKYLKNHETLLYHIVMHKVVEIKKEFSKIDNKEVEQFVPVNVKRFLTLIDGKINFFRFNKKKKPNYTTPSEQVISHFLESNDLHNALNKVERFSNFPICRVKDNKLIIPENGYNEELMCYFYKMPIIERIPTEEAKKNLSELMSDIAFENGIDRTFYYAYLLSPACRGLYSTISGRTPLNIFLGNRPGCGKDTAAGLSHLIYLGEFAQRAPFVTEKICDDDENRKKLVAALHLGTRMYHSSNNRGALASEFLEKVIQDETIKERLLGGNTQTDVKNECDFSLSGNIGLQINPDGKRRIRIINLRVYEENIEKKVYTHKDINHFVLKNRAKLLSSIYSLIADWVEAGQQSNKIYSGFQEWARVVGGICEFHGFGDPTVIQEDEVVQDSETASVKALFESCINDLELDTFRMSDFVAKIYDLKSEGHFEKFNFKENFEEKKLDSSSTTRLGLLIKKYTKRIYFGRQLIVFETSKNSSRTTYKFIKTN